MYIVYVSIFHRSFWLFLYWRYYDNATRNTLHKYFDALIYTFMKDILTRNGTVVQIYSNLIDSQTISKGGFDQFTLSLKEHKNSGSSQTFGTIRTT